MKEDMMTKENKKKTKLKFKSLSEMNHHILTERYGLEFAERVRKRIEKCRRIHLESPSQYIN